VPEGPEIRRAADRLAAALGGEKLRRVRLLPPALRRFERALTGDRVVAVDTRGKAMLTRFAGGLTLYSHNQLYGRWWIVPAGREPQTRRALRVALETGTQRALLYSASDIALLADDELARHPFLSALGPDVLDARTDATRIRERLADPAFRRRRLASLYLDQHFLAGIGNYLRAEILFFARVHPLDRPCDLDAAARARLARQTVTVTRRAYRTGGVTNRPAKAARLRHSGAGYEARRFAVYQRAGWGCHDCGTPVRRIDAGGRGLFYCPTCQPAVTAPS